MSADNIVRYDAAFLLSFEELGARLEAKDRPALYRFLREAFDGLFRMQQYYARDIAEGGAPDLEQADAQTRRELMRPLTHRQYRLIERAFLSNDDDDVLSAVWDFLHDNGRVYEKKVMSTAELAGFSLILEQAYCCLARSAGEGSGS
ncbi:MAG: hypothetical protein E7317_01845 [Clostridiales bacterium]|nr:hypothetical protein [Clostridiales bacterium]